MSPDAHDAIAPSPPEQTRSLRLLRLRRFFQAAVVLLFALLPWAWEHEFTGLRGSLFAFDFFDLPLADPLSGLHLLLVDHNFVLQLCLGGGISLLLAFALGRFFCGWLCPYGLLSELVHSLRGRPRSGKAAGSPDLRFRLVVFLLGLIAAVLLGLPVLQRLSLPGELSLAPLRARESWEALGLALLVPALPLLVEMVSGERLWCRFICPQSVCLSLAARCNPGGFGVRWTPGRCSCAKHDRVCADACSLRLNPRQKNGPPRSECVQCGDCVLACAKRGGALRLGCK